MKKSASRSVTASFRRRIGDKMSPIQEQPESDFDGAWKEAFKLYLSLFLEKFFPSIAANIDWRVKPVWLDKELSRVIGRAKSKAKVVDLLVRVGLKNGGSLRLLLHVEIQSAQEQNFAARLVEYNGGLTYVFHEPVVTLVVLGDLNADWMPTEHHFQMGEFLSHHRFPVCKLVRELDTHWQDDWSLPVIVARAQIEALRTRNDPEQRQAVKLMLIRRLFELNLKRADIVAIYALLDWMVRLRPELEAELNRQIVLLEKEKKMRHITSMERQGMEIGRREGLKEGLKEGLRKGHHDGLLEGHHQGLRQGQLSILIGRLQRQLGELPIRIRKQIESLPNEVIEEQGLEILDIKSLSELREWLKIHSDSVISK